MNVYPTFEFDVVQWLNVEPGFDPASLRGRVVLVETFQMLCPGCVSYGIPQALKVHRTLSKSQVAVVGLHTVFEHHSVMNPEALKVFLLEYRVDFPVGVDRHVNGRDTPSTMSRYGLQGTPSTLLLDRAGQLRHTSFGQVDDLALGALLGQLLSEAPAVEQSAAQSMGEACRPGEGCS